MILTMSTAGLVCFICILTLAIVDLGLVLFRGTGSSVSQFLIMTALKSPLVAIAFGASVGHLWFFMAPLDCAVDWVDRMIVTGCGIALGSISTIVIQQIVKGAKWH